MSENQIALVTGASRGIGQAIAVQLGRQGMTIIGTATSERGASKISSFLKEQGFVGEGLQLNVCDAENVSGVLAYIQETYGVVNVLINNAGITKDSLLLRMSEEQWDDVLATNLTAVYRLTKLCLRPMLKTRWGRIVNISSVVGVTGNPGQANYVAAKAGLIGFTKSLALEIARYGITVNAVAPGFIETDMTSNLNDKQREGILGMVPMHHMGSPQDIAHAVGFLVAKEAGYITGQTLHVNGGMCMV